ncbi:PQQ-dependent sugar dehydrogenase [Phenylobacterium sp.]|jgi:glucose/arabinose dehydrogenase|uniref:PQQ-dependent sugar dehydrogenase n=1 Tax=Phenylobacterium sp. TaxID=1871053 RepID=UPI002F943222
MQKLFVTTTAAVLVAACGGTDGQAAPKAAPARAAAPVQTAAANGVGQKPAFAGQTRAPEVKSNVAYQVSDYVTGLQKPWGLAFLPNGALLISEKPGRLRVFENGKLSEPVAGLPPVDTRGQGGLLGLAIDPNYARNGLVYWSYAEGQPDGKTNTAVARGQLISSTAAGPRLENVQVIWRQKPSWESTLHFGSRLVFARDGTLFVTTGERSVESGRMQARNLQMGLGKIVRINADGSIPKDNPFVGRSDAQPEIFASGIRNSQAAALNPRTGELWEIEHGTKGGDELNIIRKGKDYGWPTAAYGIEYRGGPIGGGLTQAPGTEQPVYYWDPVIAPSGMAFYTANLFPAWKGSLFVGGLGDKRLTRLVLNGDRVVGEERLLAEVGERLRDVVVGPDGALYIATDNDKGRVLRVAPR